MSSRTHARTRARTGGPARRHRQRMRVSAAALDITTLTAAAGTVLFFGALHPSLSTSLVEAARQQAAAVDARLTQGASLVGAVVSGQDDVVIQSAGRRRPPWPPTSSASVAR